ncbi:MAG TPA: PEGA domain-containing protein [bacterium]|nr:PEGA domain-containing protein [bacterium]
MRRWLSIFVLVFALAGALWAQERPAPEAFAPDLTLSIDKLFGEYTFWRQTEEGYESGYLVIGLDHTWTLVVHVDRDYDRYPERYEVRKGAYAVEKRTDGARGFQLSDEGATAFLDDARIVDGRVQSFTYGERSFTRRHEQDPYFNMVGNQPKLAGQLIVGSNPPGAAVYVDGHRVPGSTPLTIVKPAADRELHIRVVRQDYRPAEKTIALTLDENRSIHFDLFRGDSGLSIKSLPRVKVALDGRALGTTPLALNDLPAGRHELALTNEALGIDHRETFTIAEGETFTRSYEFTGRLVIDVGRACRIYRRDRLAGRTPFDERVPVGRHVLLLVDENGERRRLTVDIAPDQTTTIQQDFTALPEAD